MGEKKQIVSCYDGEIKSEDTQVDSDGKLTVPKKEQIIEKHGQKWRGLNILRYRSPSFIRTHTWGSGVLGKDVSRNPHLSGAGSLRIAPETD